MPNLLIPRKEINRYSTIVQKNMVYYDRIKWLKGK